MTIDARHDGLGTVDCEVCLRQPCPPEWAFSAVLEFDAAAHLGTAAGELGRLLG